MSVPGSAATCCMTRQFQLYWGCCCYLVNFIYHIVKERKEGGQMKISNACVVLLILISVLISGCAEEEYGEEVEKASIGISATSLLSALIHIAQEKRYFLEEGVDVEIKGYSAGRFAFQAMLDGEVDISTVSDPNIVVQSFERNGFAAFATIVDSADHVKVLTRQDAGVSDPADLRGKKVATTIGTTAYFSMVSFFVFNNLALEDVEIIDLTPEEMVEAITNREVDVIFTWEPNIMEAQENLGEEAHILPNESGYAATFSLASKMDLINKNPEMLEKLIKALIKAEEFARQNEQESIEIVAVAVDKDKQDIGTLWGNYNFRISLDQTLILTLETEARWAINNGLVNPTRVPNYLNYIYVDALEAVKPEAIAIIR